MIIYRMGLSLLPLYIHLCISRHLTDISAFFLFTSHQLQPETIRIAYFQGLLSYCLNHYQVH